MGNMFKQLASYSLLGLLRSFRMRCMGKELLVTGSCHCCGSCCRKINLEGHRGWLRSKHDFYEVLHDYPEYKRFVITGKDEQGFLQFSCSWINSDGYCKDHGRRLALCRNFPDKSLHFCGGVLPSGCGYLISEVRPFKSYLADMEKEKSKQ